MNHDMKMFYILVAQLIVSGVIEVYFQMIYHISNLGVIAMIFLAVCTIHDMFLFRPNEKRRRK
jgi:hypothetical protein